MTYSLKVLDTIDGHRDLVAEGLAEYNASADARLLGELVGGEGTLSMVGSGARLLVIEADGEAVGFSIARIDGPLLVGLMVYVRPAWRKRGVWFWFHNAGLDLARSLGLRGVTFTSTLPEWKVFAPLAGFHAAATVWMQGV